MSPLLGGVEYPEVLIDAPPPAAVYPKIPAAHTCTLPPHPAF